MNGVKGFFQSKTMWGAMFSLASVAPTLAAFVGWSLTADDATQVVQSLQAISGSIGVILTIVGRFTAKEKVVLGGAL